jgi:hypothetical protein
MVAQKQVEYLVEVDALLAVVVQAVTDVKAGKTVGEVVGGLVPLVVKALSGLSQVNEELKDKTRLESTVALKMAEVLKALGV